MRIAMWSGPRNLSTAMMYAFAQRPDCTVWDEPFYAAYLEATGLEHPMRTDILNAGERDPSRVAALCAARRTGERPVFYQKHMTQHMLPDFPRDWMAEVRNVFLIRHPARVVASYVRKREAPTLDDIGFRQQTELFNYARDLGQQPIVIDSADIRANPQTALERLCEVLGLGFDPAMLRWPAGGHASDGVWAAHWYGAVHRSTGFAGPDEDMPELSGAYADLAASALPYYDALRSEI